jgi:signal transduction histidine kinase/CheY-like chemotaxis protein
MAKVAAEFRERDKPVFLSLLPARPGERIFAFAVMGVSLATFALLAPLAKVPLQRLDAFIPLYQSALVINDLITAVLLFGQFSILRSRGLLILANAYLFTALMVVAHTLSFPGLFAAGGLLGAGPQTTAWIYMFWHAGFPLLVIAYTQFDGRSIAGRPGHAIGISAALTAVAAAALTLLTTAGQGLLPAIMIGNRYTPAMIVVVASVWVLSLVALLILGRRRNRSSLDLWLIVVVTAWLLDVALAAVLNAGRFDLGFYAGRIYGLLAASTVLMVLLLETRSLHARYVGDLQKANHALRYSEEQLRQLNDTLEQRVQERSRRLEAEIAGREKLQTTLREAQKLEAVGRMAGGIAHDFNNLLTIVIGNVEILQDALRDKVAMASVEAIDRAASRGARLIRQLMTFSRRQPIKVVAIDLATHIGELKQLLEQSLRGDIRLVVDLADSLWPVHCDRDEFDLALMNICVNARDAMPRGGLVRIEARNATLAAIHDPALGLSGYFVAITITDTGTGIASENLNKIFEPFFTTKDVGQGTGLGLSQVYGFAKQTGGNVTVSSPPGQGVSITLYLPRATAAASAALPAKPVVLSQARGTVLLVEDDDDVADVAQRILGLIGYDSHRVRDAGTTLALLLGGQSFDLLLSDIVMPGGMSGLDLARKVRGHFPNMPILLCTGLSTAAAEADQQGFGVIAKPYRAETLADAIAQTVAAHRSESRNSA